MLILEYHIPYEGINKLYPKDLEDAKDMIRNNLRNYSLEEIELYETEYYDVYELMRED